jgi:polysaccharide biosynthesis/export protein
MKSQNLWLVRFNLLALMALLMVAAAGCKTPDYTQELAGPDTTPFTGKLPPLVVGDSVTITFSGLEEGGNPLPQEKPIKDDGTITLPDVGSVQAAGKTPGELEDIVHGLYVPAIYKHLNVTVKRTSDSVYFVRGEVKSPGRLIYTGPITVTKVITSAGDFTDFADRKDVWLIRSNGKRFKLNVNKILDGEAPDPPVYPSDQIEVRKRVW